MLSLAVLRADKLEVPKQLGGMFKVPELTVEQLALPTARISGALLHLVYQAAGAAARLPGVPLS